MAKAVIRFHYNGKIYRASKSWKCASKHDCDLFKRGVCDIDGYVEHLPCEAIHKALADAGIDGCKRGFKEVR